MCVWGGGAGIGGGGAGSSTEIPQGSGKNMPTESARCRRYHAADNRLIEMTDYFNVRESH